MFVMIFFFFFFTFDQVYDILVVNKNFVGDGPNSLTVRRGDLVEVLDMTSNKQSGIEDDK